MSSFVKETPPDNEKNIFGSGYCSSLEALLVVNLYNHHIFELTCGQLSKSVQ